ncbi:nuclease-related domain-containing protein [Nocardioides sp. WV_118_6]
MRTIHPYPRRELRRMQRAWLRRNRWLVVFAVVFFGMVAALMTVTLALTGLPVRWYLIGVAHAGIVALVLHVLNSAFLAHEGAAVFQLRGAWGEENTRSELQRAKRRRIIWGSVDSITLQAGDLDHVVVTRAGGVVVLDSKWRTAVTPEIVAEMTASARRTASRAQGLARTLLRSERGVRHRAPTPPVTVVAAVVLWGGARATVPDGHQVDGVHFIDGRKLVPWLRTLDGHVVSKEAANDLLARLREYRATTQQAGQS